jgi:hypothetical protein
MGWETRRGKHRYFIRSERRGGRVIHRSFKGAAADVAAGLSAASREAREKAVAARRSWLALWAQAGRPLDELVRLTNVLQKAILLAVGYHQHGGEWRKRRAMNAQTISQTPPAPAKPPTEPPAPAKPPTEPSGDLWQRLKALADRAQKGDASALPEIRRVLDEHPEVWKTAGDWSVHAREVWVKLASGGDAVLAESTRRRLDALQEELSRPFQEPIERLLVERLVISLLQLQYADAELAEAEKQPAAKRGDVVKCHASAQRTFEQAQKALTLHRRLIKAGPSPIDLLRPVSERSPAGRESGGRVPKSAIGGVMG